MPGDLTLFAYGGVSTFSVTLVNPTDLVRSEPGTGPAARILLTPSPPRTRVHEPVPWLATRDPSLCD
jgi:hypothetical protein